MNSHEVFIHIHQGCFAGTGAIVRLPQCQWSKPDGYGKISQCITTTKHSKAKTVCIFLGIYCMLLPWDYIRYSVCYSILLSTFKWYHQLPPAFCAGFCSRVDLGIAVLSVHQGLYPRKQEECIQICFFAKSPVPAASMKCLLPVDSRYIGTHLCFYISIHLKPSPEGRGHEYHVHLHV